MKIVVITTGGTIEKTYDEGEGTLFNKETHIHTLIHRRLRLPNTQLIVQSLMSKDSLEMDDEDRELILSMTKHQLKNQKCPVVIIHGTDTMQQTAELLEKKLGKTKFPVILTGAMKPFGFEDSDALQNITEALIAAKLATPGVYISFHGSLFDVPGVRKEKKLGTFVKS